jgi:hypothetical protein
LQLDEDQDRGAGLAQIYQELGFQQRSVFEAYRSLEFDPGTRRRTASFPMPLPACRGIKLPDKRAASVAASPALDPGSHPTASDSRGSFDSAQFGSDDRRHARIEPLFVSQGLAASVDALVGELDTAGGQATIAMLGDRRGAGWRLRLRH